MIIQSNKMLTFTQRHSENGTVMMIRKMEMAVIKNAVNPAPSLSSKIEKKNFVKQVSKSFRLQ